MMKKIYAIIIICLGVALLLSCGRNGSDLDHDDIAATEYGDIPNDSVVREEFNDDEKWINAYIRAHPEISFYYMPSDTGRFKTIAGNYTVVVDNVEMVEDRDELYKYFQVRYDDRTRERAKFNEGIDQAAEPVNGYDHYLEEIRSRVDIGGDVQGTLFVEMIIDENGSIDNAEIKDGLYGQEWADTVKTRVLDAVMNADTEWKPAQRNGQPTAMRIEIPVEIG